MLNKNIGPTDPTIPSTPATSSGEDFKDGNMKYNMSKFEYDLYHEEDDKSEKVVRVKRVAMPNKGERWRIFEDNKNVFTLEGAKLTNKEKEFLRGVEGVNFLLTAAKRGIKSFNSLRAEMKKKVK